MTEQLMVEGIAQGPSSGSLLGFVLATFPSVVQHLNHFHEPYLIPDLTLITLCPNTNSHKLANYRVILHWL